MRVYLPMYIYREKRWIVSNQGLHHLLSRKILINLSTEVSGSNFLANVFRVLFLQMENNFTHKSLLL